METIGVFVPRIRTIKPEFPQSESMGRVSREARLCFILLWTLADDLGRLRGSSRMLASLLYPYDDDAKDLIDRWMVELERESCIARYAAESDHYVQILNWFNHQKIDHPSKSKFPEFTHISRILANARESSLRTKDQGGDQGGEGIKEVHPAKSVLIFSGKDSIPDDLPAAPTGNFILQQLAIPHSYGLAVKFADAVDFIAREENMPRSHAAASLIARARFAPQGTKWTFWLQDGGWKAEKELSTEGLE